MNQKHYSLMIALLVVGSVLFLSGATVGGALFLLWPLACMSMMFMMMRGMTGGTRRGTTDAHGGMTHSHDDAPTHS